jgi:gliding motility-associated-like protein
MGGSPITSTDQNPTVIYTNPGIYDVILQVSNIDGSNAMTKTGYILVNALPTVSAGPDQTVCYGTILTLSGSGALSYVWDNGIFNGTSFVGQITTTQYTVTGTDVNGCTNTDSVVVYPNLPLNPSVSISGNSTICEGSSTTFNAVHVNGGTPSYQWQINGLNVGLDNSLYTSQTSLANGDIITCIITSSLSCITLPTATSNAIMMNVNPLVTPTVSISGINTICAGVIATFTATPTNEGTPSYLWKLNGAPVGFNSTTYTSSNLLNNDVISCVMTASNYTTCMTTTIATSNLISMTVNPLPIVNAGNDVTICSGSTTLTASGSGPVNYMWDNGLGAGSSHSVSPLATTTYSVTATSVNGCTNTDNMIVNVLSSTITPTITGPLSFCIGGSTTLIVGTSYSYYQWSNGSITPSINVITPGNYSVTVTNASGCTGTASVLVTISTSLTPTITGNNICTGSSSILDAGSGYASYSWSNAMFSQTITVNMPSTYYVTVTDGSGCSGIGQINITENPLPTVNAGNNVTICVGGSTILNATGALTYSWSPTIGLSATTGSSVTASPTMSSTYYVTGTDLNGCSNTDNVIVTVSTSLNPNITGSTSFCTGGSATLDAGMGYYSYIWSNGSVSRTINVNTPGNYSVTVTNIGGCSGIDSVSVTEGTSLTPTITGNNFCMGSNTTLNAGIGYNSYVWSTSANSQTITINSGGTYYVTVSDISGCSGVAQITISVYPLPAVNAGNNVSICNGNQTILNVTGALTYSWSPSTGLSSTSGSSVTANPTNTTEYTVTGTNINGCTNVDNIIVTVSSPPNPTITGSTTFCSGNSTTLNAGSGYTSYFWSNGLNTQSITVNSSGTYYVTVSNGCSGSTQISVTSKPSPNASFNVQGNCMGQTTFFYNTSSIVSPDFYLWEFGDGNASTETSPNHIYENSGNYTAYLVAFSLNGCRDTSQFNYVAINPLPIVSIMASDTIIYGNGNQVQLTVNSQGGNVQWSTGMQNPTISVNTAGHYSVTVTDHFGCSGTSSINIYQTNNNNNNTGSNIIVSSNIITPNGDGVNDYFTINNLQSYFNNGSNGNNGCRVEIYNMWNEIVYSSDYYNNDWNCQYYDGKSLPDGAYYYYIQCGRETLKGNINILTYSNYKK